MHAVERNISLTEPTSPLDPTLREWSLFERLGCISDDDTTAHDGIVAYDAITRLWSVVYPGEPTPVLLAREPSDVPPWPSTAPADGSTPTCLAPRRRPAAPRAPASPSRSAPIGRVAAV